MKKPNFRKNKKLLIPVALVLVIALGVGLFFGTRGSSEPVNVYPFEYLGMTEFWGDSQESYGPVTTDKIQTIYLTETQTVTEILVKAGDTVKKGDVLLSFDTTLDSLSLERKRLEVEKLKLQITDLRGQVAQTYDMVPIQDTPSVPPDEEESDQGAELTGSYRISTQHKYDGSSKDKALICWVKDITVVDDALLRELEQKAKEYQVANVQPPETTETTEATEPAGSTETTAATEPTQSTETIAVTETTLVTEPAVTTEAAETTQAPQTTEEARSLEPTVQTDPVPSPVPSSASAIPEDPESSADFYVVFKVTEGNKALSSRLVWQGMQLRKSANGSYYFKFFDASSFPDHTVISEEDGEGDTLLPVPDSGYTKQQIAQMRNQLLKKIQDTYASQKMAETEYNIMLKEVGDGNVYAEIDGEVVSVMTEEEAKQAKQPVVKVSGGGGFYVEGSVSELEKENLKPGQEVTINDWNSGQVYTGTVTQIGDFPSSYNGWNGMGNPSASYYPFQVFIEGDADLQAGSYVSMTYSTTSAENGIYLENPFLRSENGQHFVYLRGRNGKLEKRYVQVGKSLWGSYTQILSGVTAEDFLAFPYGKELKEGAPTVESDLSALYSY